MDRYAYLTVLLILAVVAASGCTSTVETGNGVVIQEFSPGLTEVYPGEPMTFFLKVKNTGSVTAENVYAELLGLDEDWAASSDTTDNPLVSGEKLPEEAWCRYTDTDDHRDLDPPDMTYGTEGETASCTWSYTTPDIPEGFTPTYDMTARVFYDYKTLVTKSFTLAPTSELMKYNEQGRTLPSSTVSSTRSPVTITVQASDPIRFWEDSITFPVAITVSNTGGGMVCLKGQCKKNDPDGNIWNKLVLEVTGGSGIEIADECSDSSNGKEVDVWKNRDNTIICDVTVSGTSSITGYEERMIGISAEYSYFIDAESSITVI